VAAGATDVTIDGQPLRVDGDVITAIDGEPVSGMSDVIRAVDTHRPGDELELTLQRGGDERTVTVTLADRPARAGG
jgi:putative serine protease PepD